MRIYWLGIMLCTLMIGVGVAEAQQNPGDSAQTEGKGKVLDLVFRVEDMGGKVQSLEVKSALNRVRGMPLTRAITGLSLPRSARSRSA